MKIIEYKYGDTVKADGGIALALGFFDGVHIGHRLLIEKTVELAKQTGLVAGVFTFPAENTIKSGAGRLYSTSQKIDILASLGVECVILCDFDSVRELPASTFAKEILIEAFDCRVALAGYNFRFGKDRDGTPELLEKIFKACGRDAVMLDEQRCHGKPLSATEIRDALSKGDTMYAAEMLGALYFIEGKVERGLGIGHRFGFPTINTPLPKDCPLQTGVYKTSVPLKGKIYTGLTNVGTCPTFGERELHAETMLLDFDGDLYGEQVRIHFLYKIRDERTYTSVEELKAQIDKDVTSARAGK